MKNEWWLGVWGYRRTLLCLFRTDPHIQTICGGIANPNATLGGMLPMTFLGPFRTGMYWMRGETLSPTAAPH